MDKTNNHPDSDESKRGRAGGNMFRKSEMEKRIAQNRRMLSEFPFLWGIRHAWSPGMLVMQVKRVKAVPMGYFPFISVPFEEGCEVWAVLYEYAALYLKRLEEVSKATDDGSYQIWPQGFIGVIAKQYTPDDSTDTNGTVSHLVIVYPGKETKFVIYCVENHQEIARTNTFPAY